MVALTIFAYVLCDKLSDSSIWDIYMRCWINLAADPVNIPSPKFMDLGLSTIDALNKGASIWDPNTMFGRPADISHWSVPDNVFGETTSVGDTVNSNSDYNYKLILIIGGKVWNLIARIMP